MRGRHIRRRDVWRDTRFTLVVTVTDWGVFCTLPTRWFRRVFIDDRRWR